jgi:hypothetical protein
VTDHLYSNPYPDDPCGDPMRSSSNSNHEYLPSFDDKTLNEDGDIAQAIALSLLHNSNTTESYTDVLFNHCSSSSSQPQSVIVIDEDLSSISQTSHRHAKGFSIKEVMESSIVIFRQILGL